MTAHLYVHDILQPHVLPIMKRFLGAIFQQDIGVTRLSPPFFGLSDPQTIPLKTGHYKARLITLAVNNVRDGLLMMRKGNHTRSICAMGWSVVIVLENVHKNPVQQRDQTSPDTLNLLDGIYSDHRVHFQWVPSHGGIDGNEKADFLSRSAAEE
ncbi:hypothetical protein TNCV_324751 [Trichonephila clavipes]|nr:hypothetical protein TNCV_324751 [Trichonephila clavipes]